MAQAAFYPRGLILAIRQGMAAHADAMEKEEAEIPSLHQFMALANQFSDESQSPISLAYKTADLAKKLTERTLEFIYDDGRKILLRVGDNFKP